VQPLCSLLRFKAFRLLTKQIFEQFGDEAEKSQVLDNLGFLAISKGAKPAAMQYLKEALLLAEKLSEPTRTILFNITLLYNSLGQYDAAIYYAHKLFAVAKPIEDSETIRIRGSLFFTTKLTVEGTGLGLSLSYDTIVKGHGVRCLSSLPKVKGQCFLSNCPSRSPQVAVESSFVCHIRLL
jgi:tetratricopeptide (TPR) repeat protein